MSRRSGAASGSASAARSGTIIAASWPAIQLRRIVASRFVAKLPP
jgi:hypothetical protein